MKINMINAVLIVLFVLAICFFAFILIKKTTNKKKTAKFFGKLPKQPKDTSKDSCDAAKKTLQNMYRRR